MRTGTTYRVPGTLAYPCIGVGLIFASGVFAQEVGTSSRSLEEVVVSATKRGDTLIQDVPMSIQALAGDELLERNALNVADFLRQVPGLSMGDNGPGDKRIVMRGVSSIGAGTVGMYFDEIVITGEQIFPSGGGQPDVKLFDMNRVEVLRGPQGTTFGSGSMSGTIRYVLNPANYDELSASVGARVSTLKNSKDIGSQYDAMVNVPLSERMAVRLSGMVLERPGYVDTRLRDDANNEDTKAVRGMFGWKIRDNLEFTFLAMYQHMDIGARTAFQLEMPNMPYSPTLNGGPVPTRWYLADQARTWRMEELGLYSTKLESTHDWGTITATTSLFDRRSRFARDTSNVAEAQTAGAYPADSTGMAVLRHHKDTLIRNSELRFSSDWDSPFQVLLGAFHMKEERDFESLYHTVNPASGVYDPAVSHIFLNRWSWYDIKQVAVFGEGTWKITDKLTLTAGLRWFDYDSGQSSYRVVDFPGVPGIGAGTPFTISEDGTIKKFTVSYDFKPDFMAYAQYAEGFRPGGANDSTAALQAGVVVPDGYGSDSLKTYELGVKSTWLDGRLVVNGAVYYTDWTDLLVNNRAPHPTIPRLAFNYFTNGSRAEIKGGELELSVLPVSGLRLNLGAGYADSKLTENLPLPTDGMKGDRFPYVPELTGWASARYEWPVKAGALQAFVSADWSYTDKTTTYLRPTLLGYRELEAYSIAGLRVGVEGDSWSVVLSIDNLFDADERIAFMDDSSLPDKWDRPWPRTISLGVRKNFAL